MKLERVMTNLTMEELCELMCGCPEEDYEEDDDNGNSKVSKNNKQHR